MKPKICMVTAYSEDWKQLGGAIAETNKAYCAKWGYDFKVHTSGFDPSRPYSWSKILFIREALKNYDYVMWIDADAVITNPEIPLDSLLCLKEELVVGFDHTGINFGVFFLRKSDFANRLLDEIWNRTEYLKHPWWEQAAVRKLQSEDFLDYHIKKSPIQGWNVEYSDTRFGQNEWKDGDFVAHFMGIEMKEKLTNLAKVKERTHSSVGSEHHLDMVGVAGSTPAASTIKPSIELKKKSPLCVVMAYTDDYKICGDFTSEVNIQYCHEKSYNFRLYRDGFNTRRHPAWSKFDFVRATMKDYEWVFWIDADAMFTNFDTQINYFVNKDYHFFVGNEGQGAVDRFFNMGTFLIQRCDWSYELLDNIWYKRLPDKREHESLTHMSYTSTFLTTGMAYYPLRGLGSHIGSDRDWRNWQTGDFIAHCRGPMYQVNKVRLLADCLLKAGFGTKRKAPISLTNYMILENIPYTYKGQSSPS